MIDNSIELLAKHDIHRYGTVEQLKFENNMSRYFEREYERWKDNSTLPEEYGVSSFEGEISKHETRKISTSHYDEEYQIYRTFLDKSYMAYTMGYFEATKTSPIAIDISLEQAQESKYKLLTSRADIKDGQTVLDLGCGFGGFSKYLLQTFDNINIVAINPSEVQTNHIKNVLINNNSDFESSRFTLICDFFEDIDESTFEDGYFDRIISVGLLEHVSNIDLLQQNISRILKKEGKCLHHCIVSFDTIPNFLNSEDTLMGHYYPGAHIWPYNEPRRHNSHLKFSDSWFINGMNYWKTLDEWHKRFWNSIDQLYPKYLTIEETENWNRYFSLCKAMFNPNKGNSYGNGQFLYEKN